MSKIGNWGTHLKFRVDDDRVLTFEDFRLDSSLRTSKHNMVNSKPKLEIDGLDLDTASMKIKISVFAGVKPRTIERKIKSCMRCKVVAPLIIGGRVILSRAVLTKVSESYDIVMRKGELAEMTLTVTFSEYG
ncbi:MAG: phage tail protein [Lachnospiraceae bacterium]|nr:phage tail protein [Lachnospiraceae bacterium]